MRRLSVIAFLAALAVSCSAPDGHEEFLRAPRESYVFTVADVDSLALYNFSFYTKVTSSRLYVNRAPFALDIEWMAPDSTVYSEPRLYLDGGSERGVVAPYRTGVRFPRSGDWTLSVRVENTCTGFTGLGLKYDIINGTR